jgi:hypothetical protein
MLRLLTPCSSLWLLVTTRGSGCCHKGLSLCQWHIHLHTNLGCLKWLAKILIGVQHVITSRPTTLHTHPHLHWTILGFLCHARIYLAAP